MFWQYHSVSRPRTLVPRPGMLPTLSSSTKSFQSWQSQLEAFFALKSIDDEKKKLLVLPTCLEEDILLRTVGYLSAGSTTLKSALRRLREVWLEVRRPADPERQFLELKFSQPSQANDALVTLKWLSEYLHFNESAIRQRFISAAPIGLQPVLLSRSSDSLDDLCNFVSTCPDDPTLCAVNAVKRLPCNITNSTEPRVCRFCKRAGHVAAECRRRLGLCLRCGGQGHRVAECSGGKND